MVSLRRRKATDEPVPDAEAGRWATRVYDLWKTYPQGDVDVHACAGITLGVARGEFVAVMGPSGSGKSTLVQLMAGLDRPTAGRVFLGDDEITHLAEKKLTRLRRDRVGFVFQAYNLVGYLTAEQNMRLPSRLGAADPDEGWFVEVVDVLGIGDRLHHRPSELSGGQQQRVALGRALLAKPDLLLGDEPTGNLDTNAGDAILDLLGDASQQLGQTVVMVTHDPHAAARAARVVFLRDGRVAGDVEDPSLDDLLARQKALLTTGEPPAPAVAAAEGT